MFDLLFLMYYYSVVKTRKNLVIIILKKGDMKMTEMVFDYSKLKGLIVEKYGTISNFAEKSGLKANTLSLKLNNKNTFNQEEMFIVCNLLGIENPKEYFFCIKN